MAKHGSENRIRNKTLSSRFTSEEANLVREMADKAGVSIASLIRFALLEQPPLRASKVPPVKKRDLAKLLGELGRIKQGIDDAINNDDCYENELLIEAIHRDLADMRAALLEALGRLP